MVIHSNNCLYILPKSHPTFLLLLSCCCGPDSNHVCLYTVHDSHDFDIPYRPIYNIPVVCVPLYKWGPLSLTVPRVLSTTVNE